MQQISIIVHNARTALEDSNLCRIYLPAFCSVFIELFISILLTFLPILFIYLQEMYQSFSTNTSLVPVLYHELQNGELFMISVALLSPVFYLLFRKNSLNIKFIFLFRALCVIILVVSSVSYTMQRNGTVNNTNMFFLFSSVSFWMVVGILVYINLFKELNPPKPDQEIRRSEINFINEVNLHRRTKHAN